MATDTPQLELSNILLNIANEITLQSAGGHVDATMGTDTLHGASRGISPEPPGEHEIFAMRVRALSIRDSKGKGREDSEINELIDMILRLTTAVPVRTQILEQADTIRHLSLQRDILLRRMDDDRARWEAERDGLQRVCEALIAQANITSHNLYKEQDSAKKPAIIEAENSSLRQKLSEIQSRANSLEAELEQLRPLLLMQPSAVAASRGLTLSPGKSAKKEESSSGAGIESRSYYRVREEVKTVNNASPKAKKKNASSYFKHAPTVADARSEHLLLAMRKLGKERATLLSQAMYHTADPPQVSSIPSNELPTQGKNSSSQPRPTISPATWSAHLQQTTNAAQQGGQANHQIVQQPGTSVSVKGQQNPPFSQFGPPAGLAYSHYFVPSGSVARPGTAMPAPAFYHGPPRGYMPGPAWPYYTPGPYAFGQPIAIQNAATANAKTPPALVRLTNSPPVAGPSHASAPMTPKAPPSSSSASQRNESSRSSSQARKSSSRGRQQSGLNTPPSKATTPGSTTRNTPMDDLLSAAQTVFSPNAKDRARASEDEGSPSPKKRRRVSDHSGIVTTQTNDKQAAFSEPSGHADRRTSALDVLADQAAGVVPSTQASGSEVRNANSSSTTVSSQRKLELNKTSDGARRNSSVRKGKRPVRASSTTPTPSASSSATMLRAASEDCAPPVSSTSNTSQTSIEFFKLRPVQSAPFPNKGARSTSHPRTSSTNRRSGRQLNGRASTPLSHGQPKHSRLNTPANSANAEDEIESEEGGDEDSIVDLNTELDHLEDENDSPIPRNGGPDEKGKQAVGSSSPGEDVNSKRWLEILGRKES